MKQTKKKTKRRTSAVGRNKLPVPLVPPPHKQWPSRKRARVLTTQFHKLTRARNEVVQQQQRASSLAVGGPAAGKLQELDSKIAAMGGVTEYQRASQVSTSHHSTSKWVLGCLARNGWLYGRQGRQPQPQQSRDGDGDGDGDNDDDKVVVKNRQRSMRTEKQQQQQRRCTTRLLEVGAINTELLDAARPKRKSDNSNLWLASSETDSSVGGSTSRHRLHVRAIDLHSMHNGIEQSDFLKIDLPETFDDCYDVVVCSMVLNCVPTAADRGMMLCRCYRFLRAAGLFFVTLPKSCLTLSPYMDRPTFVQLLRQIGFSVVETKYSPKVAFFVCQKDEGIVGTITNTNKNGTNTTKNDEKQHVSQSQWDLKQWNQVNRLYRGKKYRNDFSITISQEAVTVLCSSQTGRLTCQPQPTKNNRQDAPTRKELTSTST